MALSKNQREIVNLAAVGGTDKEFVMLQRIHEMEDEFQKKIDSIKEFIKGDKGDEGHTPTDAELLALIQPLIPDVEDGDTPTEEQLLALIKPLIPKVKDGVTPSDARLRALIRPLIPAPVDEQKMMIEIERSLAEKLPALGERIRDGLELLPEGEKLNPQAIEGWTEFEQGIRGAIAKSGGRIGWGAHPLTIQGLGVAIDKNVRFLNFTGAGLTSVTRDKNGVVTVNLGGGTVATVYQETPTGLINGSNTSYTTAHTITTVYNFAINGQFLHPSDYSVSGTTITMTTPLDASLSGLPFTITYI